MPEGDSIFKHARLFHARYVGRRVRRVLRAGVAEPRFANTTLTSAQAHGKHLELRFAPEEGDALLVRVHLGIAGGWRFGEAARLSPSAPLWLDFGDQVAFLIKAKEVTLSTVAFAAPLAHLGPDLLSASPDLDDVLRRARLPRHAARPLGELLLDQTVAAGIGNVYKSELCFLAAQHPFLRVDEVHDDKLREIYASAIQLLRSNVGAWPRTTTADRSRGELPPRGRGRYLVYGRERRPCYRCGTPITRQVMGPDLRGTFFCPRCQAP
jgi:endonuclease-8